MNRMVSTTANYELATQYLHDWVIAIINQAGRCGISATNLDGWAANRYQFQTNVSSADPVFIWLNGHGNIEKLAGQDGEIILDLGNNNILSGRVVYAFSCLTASELGPSSVSKGCTAYIGYSDEFVFVYDNTAPYPLRDKYAQWFMQAGVEVGSSLLRGETAGQSLVRSQSLFDTAIGYWNTSSDPVAPSMLACLYQDKNCQRLLGSESARVNTGYYPMPLSVTQAGLGGLILPFLILTGLYYLYKGRFR
jgi:hypothetical protein